MKKITVWILICMMLLTACGQNAAEDKKTDKPNSYEAGGIGGQKEGEELSEEKLLEKVKQDPENAASYLALADIYIRQGEYQAAWDILNQGLEETDSASIESKLLEFNNANVILDSDSRLRGKSHFSDGQLQWCHIYTYEGEKFTEITHYDGTMTQLGSVALTYDETGRPTQSYIYYSNTGALERLTMEYNEAGKLIKTTEYDLEDNLIGYSENTFDEAGYKTGETYYDAQGQIHWELSYTHDVENLKSTRITSFYGKQVGTSEQTYSESGYPNGGKSRFQGVYDRHIDYDVSYGGSHERNEIFEGETTYARIVHYNAPLSQLY